jgi:membrane associated rhomboid family serine protease
MSLLKSIRKPFRFEFWNASFIIIGVNVGVFILTYLFPQLYSYLALRVYTIVRYKMFWQVFTYMFVHGSLSHLFFNQLGLVFFGFSVEKAVGSREFTLFYLLTGTVSGLVSFASYFAADKYGVILVGSSGAVYAVLLLYAVVYPRSRIFIWGILPIPAPLLVLIYVGMALFNQIFSLGSGIAHLTHLAGFAAAWLYLRIRMNINPITVWKNSYF